MRDMIHCSYLNSLSKISHRSRKSRIRNNHSSSFIHFSSSYQYYPSQTHQRLNNKQPILKISNPHDILVHNLTKLSNIQQCKSTITLSLKVNKLQTSSSHIISKGIILLMLKSTYLHPHIPQEGP